MAFPLSAGGEVLGVLGFATTRAERAWAPEVVGHLQTVARVLANAIARKAMHRAVRGREDDWRGALDEVQKLRQRLEQENRYLREEVKGRVPATGILGTSAAIRRVLTQIEPVAPTPSTVLLRGETGTGKEVVASAIHANSPRRDRALARYKWPGTVRELRNLIERALIVSTGPTLQIDLPATATQAVPVEPKAGHLKKLGITRATAKRVKPQKQSTIPEPDSVGWDSFPPV